MRREVNDAGRYLPQRETNAEALRARLRGPSTILTLTLLAGVIETACQQSPNSALTVAIADWSGSLDPDYARTQRPC